MDMLVDVLVGMAQVMGATQIVFLLQQDGVVVQYRDGTREIRARPLSLNAWPALRSWFVLLQQRRMDITNLGHRHELVSAVRGCVVIRLLP